ncbi:hypothetical protein AU197_04465 [Mycobacterium sp. IS-1590]|uniref:hypothetical protein n=1 Tax=Mycobacterium sp. IS-1590 TaxID=1772286 RepID=UPI00074AF35B|nr:hypothetical protein [Mycobacterium sp. IS-1590]KUI43333.1 hypothetical protein AU197_04465 [Mycobacterium sp. IS-1590]
MYRPGGNDQPQTADRPGDDQDWVTFSLRPPRWPTLVRLRGRDPLVRSVDRIEALIMTLVVVMSLVAVPIAGAVGTALFDSRHAAVEAVTAGALVLLAVLGTAAAVVLITRTVCDRARSARWQRGLDTLIDGRGQARMQ